MNLTEQELKAIEQEAEETYIRNSDILNDIQRRAYASGLITATNRERIKAKKLLELLMLIPNMLPSYQAEEVSKFVKQAIAEYNKNS